MTSTLLDHAPHTIGTHYVSLSEEIRLLLLDAFIDGELASGARINDLELATRLGVSRTPVREALRGLQALGIVETLPARVTRVAKLSVEEYGHAQTVWSSLYRVLLSETINTVTGSQIAEMTELCNRLADATATETATISFRFFDLLARLTENPFLQESVYAAACRIRLGFYDSATEMTEHFRLTFAQASGFIAALQTGNLADAQQIVDTIVGTTTTESNDRVAVERHELVTS